MTQAIVNLPVKPVEVGVKAPAAGGEAGSDGLFAATLEQTVDGDAAKVAQGEGAEAVEVALEGQDAVQGEESAKGDVSVVAVEDGEVDAEGAEIEVAEASDAVVGVVAADVKSVAAVEVESVQTEPAVKPEAVAKPEAGERTVARSATPVVESGVKGGEAPASVNGRAAGEVASAVVREAPVAVPADADAGEAPVTPAEDGGVAVKKEAKTDVVSAVKPVAKPAAPARAAEPALVAETVEPANSEAQGDTGGDVEGDSESDSGERRGGEGRRDGAAPGVVFGENERAAVAKDGPGAVSDVKPVEAVKGELASAPETVRAESTTSASTVVKDASAAVERAPAVKPVAAQSGESPSPQQASEGPRSVQQATERTMLASAQRGLNAALAQRGGEMTVRLAPEALGALRVSLTVAQGSVSASFTPETAEAARILQSGLESLRESIESRGLTVERLRVAPVASAQASADAGDARQDQNTARRDEARSDSGDGRSRGRGEREQDQQGRKNGDGSRFEQQWRHALDASA